MNFSSCPVHDEGLSQRNLLRIQMTHRQSETVRTPANLNALDRHISAQTLKVPEQFFTPDQNNSSNTGGPQINPDKNLLQPASPGSYADV